MSHKIRSVGQVNEGCKCSMKEGSRVTRGPEWSREYDSSYCSYYYFNAKTGESEWIEEGDENEDGTALISGNGGSNFAEIELTTTATPRRSNNDDDDEGEDNLEEEDEADGINLISDSMRVYADTEAAMNSQKRCLLVNACLCECPMAIIEGIVRASCFAGLGIALMVLAACTFDYQWVKCAKQCAREATLTAAAVLSLLVPFMACFAYRKYNNDDDWDLSPLPTLLGWVDTQRFMAFSFGGGSYAQQRMHSDIGSAGDGGDIFDLHDEHSADTWKEGILMAPRRVFRTLTKIARGRFES